MNIECNVANFIYVLTNQGLEQAATDVHRSVNSLLYISTYEMIA